MDSNNKLKIIECKNDLYWDDFVSQSYNQNFFSLSDLINLDKHTKKYFLLKNNETLASFSLNQINNKIIEPKYRIYSPINYKNFKNSKISSINLNYYNINNFIYQFLINNFNNINITFDYFTKDIRPFLWHGYPDYKKKFSLNIRYTLVSDIKNINRSNFLKSFIYLNSSETNRREIRNSLNKNFKFEEVFSKEIFIKLKTSSSNIHKKKIDISHYEELLKAYDLLRKKNKLKMFVSYLKNEPVFMTVFGVLNNNSVFLESGRSDIANNNNLIGVFSMFNSIISLSKNNIEKIDFEGINSPNNSISKLKYGGGIKPYYSLKL